MESLLPPSSNTLPPAVAKTAHCPNQTLIGIENPEKFDDDDLSALWCYIYKHITQ